MSGGSWDYVHWKFEDVANRLINSKCIFRQALGYKVKLISQAMHDIEWVDSGDYGHGDEIEAIKKVLNPESDRESLKKIVDDQINGLKGISEMLDGDFKESMDYVLKKHSGLFEKLAMIEQLDKMGCTYTPRFLSLKLSKENLENVVEVIKSLTDFVKFNNIMIDVLAKENDCFVISVDGFDSKGNLIASERIAFNND